MTTIMIVQNCVWFSVLFLLLHVVVIDGENEIDPNEDTAAFFDMEMGKDRSLTPFYYKGGYLSIYEGRNENLKRSEKMQ
jgi:hypothetical protein